MKIMNWQAFRYNNIFRTERGGKHKKRGKKKTGPRPKIVRYDHEGNVIGIIPGGITMGQQLAILRQQESRPRKRKIRTYVRERKTTPTSAELKLYRQLQQNGYQVLFQHPFQHGKSFYILDIYVCGKKIAIEVDGGYHNTARQKIRDQKRDQILQATGLKVLRISNDDVYNHIDTVIERINTIAVSPCGESRPKQTRPEKKRDNQTWLVSYR